MLRPARGKCTYSILAAYAGDEFLYYSVRDEIGVECARITERGSVRIVDHCRFHPPEFFRLVAEKSTLAESRWVSSPNFPDDNER